MRLLWKRGFPVKDDFDDGDDPVALLLVGARPESRDLSPVTARLLFDRALVNTYRQSRRRKPLRRWAVFAAATGVTLAFAVAARLLPVPPANHGGRTTPAPRIEWARTIAPASGSVRVQPAFHGRELRIGERQRTLRWSRLEGHRTPRTYSYEIAHRSTARKQQPLALRAQAGGSRGETANAPAFAEAPLKVTVSEAPPSAKGFARVTASANGPREVRTSCTVEGAAATTKVTIARVEAGRHSSALSVETTDPREETGEEGGSNP
jgi:hypothetical protein